MFTDNSIPSRNFPEFRKFNVPKRHYAKLFTERMQNTNRKSRGLRPRKSKSKTLMYTASVVKAAWLVDGATAGATIPGDGASSSTEYWLNRPFMIKHAPYLMHVPVLRAMWARWPGEMHELAVNRFRTWGSPSVPHLHAYLTLSCGAAQSSRTPNEGPGSGEAVYLSSKARYLGRIHNLLKTPPKFFVMQDSKQDDTATATCVMNSF